MVCLCLQKSVSRNSAPLDVLVLSFFLFLPAFFYLCKLALKTAYTKPTCFKQGEVEKKMKDKEVHAYRSNHCARSSSLQRGQHYVLRVLLHARFFFDEHITFDRQTPMQTVLALLSLFSSMLLHITQRNLVSSYHSFSPNTISGDLNAAANST